MKEETFFIEPTRPGLIVRDPVTAQPLPEAGAEKPRNSYWLRRVADGDVRERRAMEASTAPAEGPRHPRKHQEK